MSNLVAYIPVINRRHLDWFRKHPNPNVVLISQEVAEELLPRLSRNVVALPTLMVEEMLFVAMRRDSIIYSVGTFSETMNANFFSVGGIT